MKTIQDFVQDEEEALNTMADFLRKKGYEVATFYNMEGSYTLSVEVKDEENDKTNVIATFERW